MKSIDDYNLPVGISNLANSNIVLEQSPTSIKAGCSHAGGLEILIAIETSQQQIFQIQCTAKSGKDGCTNKSNICCVLEKDPNIIVKN